MFENLHYRQKIILFITVIFLLTAVSLVFIYSTSRKNLISGHNERLEKTAQLTINILNRDIATIKKIILLFEKNNTLTEYLYSISISGHEKEPLEELSKNIMEPLNFSLLVLYDKTGNELVHVDVDNPGRTQEPIKKLPDLTKHKNISGFAIDNGKLRILAMGPMAYKPSPLSTDVISYVKIGANIDTNYLNLLKENSGNEFFILKGNDILLSTQKEVSPAKISGQEMDTGGNKYSIKPISLKSIYGEEIGTFIIALPQKDLAAALKKLKFTFLFMALGSLLISGLFGITLIRTLTSSLNRIVKLTEQVGSGKFPEEKTFEGSDEVSVLGRHFLEMTKKLKDQKKALDSYTSGLEDAVMKRTQELFNSKEEWARTFNSITDYVLMVDHDYRIVRTNKALLNKLDLTNQELSGKKCYEIFCGKSSTPGKCPIRETLTTGKPSIMEINYDNMDGHFMATASPITSEDGEITGTVYVVKDITEYRNIQLQMINAEKLASMGQMAAGFAHEINNPMSSIAGCAELLIDQLDSDELRKISQHDYFLEYLNIIYREAFRCRDIIRGMLRFSRKEFERGTIDINSLLKEVLLLLDHTIKVQKIHLVEEYGSSTNLLQADEGEIRQILLALIVNAIDVMPNEGTLTIKTQDLNENIHITIQDTGSGIPSQIRDKVFDPFFTTKPVGKGTGLGLFIAFNLLKKYRGKIELKSTGSTGSTFTVTLPIGTYTLSEQQ